MAAFSSPLRFVPPLTPRRAPSPAMSPGGRRGRTHGSSEESHLRDLSPSTTLRAFTQKPLPFDTTRDEYKIFVCIDSLTAAERELGARVAKAAQRLKSWCAEIEQWGWSGSFEPPSAEYREKRRRSLELRIREHVGDVDLSSALPPLEYWGSLLSVEVESHEARLDDIEEEMLKLDVDELKEHVLDMHPAGRSPPPSARVGANGRNYKPMDDFSFLITQTLLSALPHHAQLKERLNTWTARISTLRDVPRYLDDLATTQKAMRLGWDAIEPPADTSDTTFRQWKEAVDTISDVLRSKVSDLGKRLDVMLDTLEGREDCIPDSWIDAFEAIEADHGRWTHESRRRVIDFDLRRTWEKKGVGVLPDVVPDNLDAHSNHAAAPHPSNAGFPSMPAVSAADVDNRPSLKAANVADVLSSDKATLDSNIRSAFTNKNSAPRSATAFKADIPTISSLASDFKDEGRLEICTPLKVAQSAGVESASEQQETGHFEPQLITTPKADSTPVVSKYSLGPSPSTSVQKKKLWFLADDAPHFTNDEQVDSRPVKPLSSYVSAKEVRETSRNTTPTADTKSERDGGELESLTFDDESDFEEGDTVVHNEVDDSPEVAVPVQSVFESNLGVHDKVDQSTNNVVHFRHRPANLSEAPAIITTDGEDGTFQDPPQTPRSRRGSMDSLSSNMSFDSSPSNIMEDSPSLRNATNRAVRAPRPELNAAMAKRRTGRSANDNGVASAPWPPTQFSQKPTNSADDLERKISDILTTIPAHIRLTSGPGADAPEVKPTRGLAAKGSRAYLRAARSVSGLKSPELTLSPAKSDFDTANAAAGRKSAAAARGDNDIKLYHLTQPGKEQPIKLFIRRVGENGERVMVRVGGGWADLGEYLRQYAEHHGRRTVSDGKFEVLGLEVAKPDTVNSPVRPESTMSQRDRRFSGGRPTTSPNTTPVKATGPGFAKGDPPPPPPMPSFASTPGTAEETSIPSTNSSQRSWTGNEVGLAGPKAKKLDLSGEKLEWIEGMMKQARTVSGNVITASHAPLQREERAESRSESRAGARKPEFGDLGKVGGTKRIFLRGGRPSLEEQH